MVSSARCQARSSAATVGFRAVPAASQLGHDAIDLPQIAMLGSLVADPRNRG